MYYHVRTYYRYDDDFYMSIVRPERVDDELTGGLPGIIYISDQFCQKRPLIKFDGGTPETEGFKNGPAMLLDRDGTDKIELQTWMNKDNCPNAFDREFVQKLDNFLGKFRPILILVWYGKLDKLEAIRYFKGQKSLKDLLSTMTNVSDEAKEKVLNCNSIEELHVVCVKEKLYRNW